ncbi:MAG: DUF3611 family protein [Synechococcales bacterium]|nr:DUF3611 family protein [Synechococcales bacterium]
MTNPIIDKSQSDRPIPASPPTTSSPAAPPPTVLPAQAQQSAKLLRLAGWSSFWLQLLIGVVSIVMLLFVSFSRNLSDDATNIQTGFSIFLIAIGIAVLLFSTFTSFRYTRLGKRITSTVPHRQPSKQDVLQVLHVGAIASLVGMALTILASAVSTGVLLAKLMAQPQGAAIYDPTEIVRVIDVLVIMAGIAVVAAHYGSSVTSLWLINRIK